MVVNDFDIVGAAIFPFEADTPLFVNADAVLSSSVSFQCFEVIAWWDAECVECSAGVSSEKFIVRAALDVRWQL
ncbi:MAG: hypothetical protein ACI8Z5_001400 [Lentimonas sp.]|jgi:hypothetical protein